MSIPIEVGNRRLNITWMRANRETTQGKYDLEFLKGFGKPEYLLSICFIDAQITSSRVVAGAQNLILVSRTR